MASGYGADRGSKPTQVRSGVFRGALLVLLPLVETWKKDAILPNLLVQAGAEEMKNELTKKKYLPLP